MTSMKLLACGGWCRVGPIEWRGSGVASLLWHARLFAQQGLTGRWRGQVVRSPVGTVELWRQFCAAGLAYRRR